MFIQRFHKLAFLFILCGHLSACNQIADSTKNLKSTSESPPVSGGGGGGGLSGFFPAGSPWTRDVSAAPLDSGSDAVIQWLKDSGGWGSTGGLMRVDFSIHLLEADASTPRAALVKNTNWYDGCDLVSSFPLPVGGSIEGVSGYTCDTVNDDCHLLVVDRSRSLLFESYGSTVNGMGQVVSKCVALWDLTKLYPPENRGDQCTSADAAGYPMAPLLFNADEVAAGEIKHAIRFILPNTKMRKGFYVRPASHAGGPNVTSGLPPIYGMRFRLKANYPVDKLNPAAQVVARAMQKYGMLLADGGNIALTAQNDRYTTHKWSEVGFSSSSLTSLLVTDFEVIDAGARIPLTYNCKRNTY